MSYKLAVLRDHPIAFFPLNASSVLRTYATILQEYNTYQDWLDNEPSYGFDPVSFTMEDISDNGSHSAAFTLGSANFLDILPLTTLANYDTELSGCRINNNGEISISNIPQLYQMFYTGTENLSFNIEMWINFEKTPVESVNLLKVDYENNNIMKINANSNILSMTVSGVKAGTSTPLTYTVYKKINDWSLKTHIVAIYSKKQIDIVVNGEHAGAIALPSNFCWKYSAAQSSSFYYNVGPSSIQDSFIINDIAFYDYNISSSMIGNHIGWGANNAKPQASAQLSDSYFFDINESKTMFAYDKIFNTSSSYSAGIINNLIANPENNGLTIKNIPDLEQISSVSFSNGMSASSDSALRFNLLSSYVNFNNMSIAGQINWSSNSTGSPATILAFDSISGTNTLYLAQDTNNTLSLYYYSQSSVSPYTYSSQLLAQTATSVNSSGTYNFGISVNGNTISIYLENSGSASYTMNNITGQGQFNFYLGNQFADSSSGSLIGSIKNIAILNSYTDLTSYLYGNIDQIFLPLSQDASIYQKGTWVYNLPTSYLTNSIGGRVIWNSGTTDDYVNSPNNYVKFEASLDYGNTWFQIEKDSPLFQIADSSSYVFNDISVRATIVSDNSSFYIQPEFSNVDIALYDDLSFNSDSGAFTIRPLAGAFYPNTYSIKNNKDSILTRPTNFGIKLASVNDLSSVAEIYNNASVTIAQSVEFWFRPESYGSSTNPVIISAVAEGAYLSVDPSTNTVTNTNFANVYINGQSIGSGRILTTGEIYHFVCVLNNPSLTNFYLGGDGSSSGYSYGTFGYVNMYNYSVTQSNALSRYLQYLTATASQVDITSQLNTIGTVSEYSGENTDYNNGLPILAYNSI